MLSVVAAVYQRELRAFHRTPGGWLILLVAGLPPLAAGAWLVAICSRGGLATRAAEQPVTQFLGPNLFLVATLLILVPLLTMNLIAEERRRGAWELYATAAGGVGGVVVGKFLAAWSLLLACLAPWPLLLGLLAVWNGQFQMITPGGPALGSGLRFDPALLLGGMLGLAVVGASLTAVGTCCSAWCRSPTLAAMATGAVLGLLVLLSLVPTVLENWRISADQYSWVRNLAVWMHLAEFSQGAISIPRCGQHGVASVILLWLSRLACHELPARST